MLYVDEVEKSSMLFQWNEGIVILLDVMRGSRMCKCSGNSCCVLDFIEWRVNIDGTCS